MKTLYICKIPFIIFFCSISMFHLYYSIVRLKTPGFKNDVTANSKFPPTIWAAPPDPDTKRTTNGPESFHSHLNAQSYMCHPTIFIFLDVLLKIQTPSYTKIRTLHIQAATRKNEKERLDFAIETYEKFVASERSKIEFVKTVGYTYSARTDTWFLVLMLYLHVLTCAFIV